MATSEAWELNLRRQLHVQWAHASSAVMPAARILLQYPTRVQRLRYDVGTIHSVTFDLIHLKLLPTHGIVPVSPDISIDNGIQAYLRKPGLYVCSAEGTVGESCFVVVRIPVIGTLKRPEDHPRFYMSEEEAILALAVPLLIAGSEEQQDLAISLQHEGVAGIPRARVVLGEERSRAINLPALSGSLKQIAWVSILREELVAKIKEAEESKGSESHRIEVLMRPRRYGAGVPPLDALETLTFAELHAELQRVTDAEAWIAGRHSHIHWLAGRALDRRNYSPGRHPF